jgi:hypothetical protein
MVLWDLTTKHRPDKLVELKHWLINLQLQLGSPSVSSSVFIFIIGTHWTPEIDRHTAENDVRKVVALAGLSIAHEFHIIDVWSRRDVDEIRTRVFAHLAKQQYVGEDIPKPYMDLYEDLQRKQIAFRDRPDNQVPLFKVVDLQQSHKIDITVIKRALLRFSEWGFVWYFGSMSMRSRLDEIVVLVPEWLTVKILGSLGMFAQRKCTKQIGILSHADLQAFTSWASLDEDEQDKVMKMLYSMDLLFPIEDFRTPFKQRTSCFPQM